MMSVFYGELLIHPSAIDISGNTCTHNCCYCFANIRKKKRYSDLRQCQRFLCGESNSKGLINHFVRNGYSINISNRSDPFSESNHAETIALLKILSKRNNPIHFQTKGGAESDRALEILKDKKEVIFYITITTINDAIAKRIEPGAPPPEQRIALAIAARKAGFGVIIAVNPCVEEWMPEEDLVTLEKRMRKHGIINFMFQRLKIRPVEYAAMPDSKKMQFEKSVVERFSGKDVYFQRQVDRQRSIGLLPIAFGMPYTTDFYHNLEAEHGKRMFGNYDFFNACAHNGHGYVYFGDYLRAIVGKNRDLLEVKSCEFTKYIINQNRGVWKGNAAVQNIVDFESVVREFWNNRRLGGSPQNNYIFQTVQKPDGKRLYDDAGNVVLYFDGSAHYKDRIKIEGDQECLQKRKKVIRVGDGRKATKNQNR